MKIIQQFQTLYPGLPNAKESSIPCQIDFDKVDFFDRYFSIKTSDTEKIDFYLGAAHDIYKSFQLTNAIVFTEVEIRQMAKDFEFDLLPRAGDRLILSAVLLQSSDPESILYSDFYNFYGRNFCVIRQVNGHGDADAALPLIWRVAEVELSAAFSEKLEHKWKEKLKVYTKGPPPGFTKTEEFKE